MSRKGQETSLQTRRAKRLLKVLLARLDGPGNKLDAARVYEHLRCALTGQRVPDEACAWASLGQWKTIPMPPAAWLRIAYLNVAAIGLRSEAMRLLDRLYITTVGDLLLHTEVELLAGFTDHYAKSPRRAAAHIVQRLDENGLRLPTTEEHERARRKGFWTQLDIDGDERQYLRTARFALPYVSMGEVRQLFPYERWPYEELKLFSLGDVLKLTKDAFTAKWVDYCLEHGEWPSNERDSVVLEMFRREGEAHAQLLIDWLNQNDLAFAAR